MTQLAQWSGATLGDVTTEVVWAEPPTGSVYKFIDDPLTERVRAALVAAAISFLAKLFQESESNRRLGTIALLEAPEPGRPPAEQLAEDVIALLETQPLESGAPHPVENVLLHALGEAPKTVGEAFDRLKGSRPWLGPQFVRCLGRLPRDIAQVGAWSVVVASLRSADIAMRDAAVRALEGWGSSEALAVLEAHRESVGWLADYIRRVIGGLRR
jgi:hypothetical protein